MNPTTPMLSRVERDVLAVLAMYPRSSPVQVLDAINRFRWWPVFYSGVTLALMRFERLGLVASEFAEGPYPRRRLYWLAGGGS